MSLMRFHTIRLNAARGNGTKFCTNPYSRSIVISNRCRIVAVVVGMVLVVAVVAVATTAVVAYEQQ